MFYLRKEKVGWFFNSFDPFSDYYPAYYLGKSILSNTTWVGIRPGKQSKLMREIEQAAHNLTNQLITYPAWAQPGHLGRRAEKYILPWDWNA